MGKCRNLTLIHNFRVKCYLHSHTYSISIFQTAFPGALHSNKRKRYRLADADPSSFRRRSPFKRNRNRPNQVLDPPKELIVYKLLKAISDENVSFFFKCFQSTIRETEKSLHRKCNIYLVDYLKRSPTSNSANDIKILLRTITQSLFSQASDCPAAQGPPAGAASHPPIRGPRD